MRTSERFVGVILLTLLVAGCSVPIDRMAEQKNPTGAELTSFTTAMAANDWARVEQQLADRPTLASITGPDGRTALHKAVQAGNEAIVALLLEKGAPANFPRATFGTPLQQAARNGLVGIVALLLDHQADPNQAAGMGDAPIYVASFAGHTDVVGLLLDRGAKIDLRSTVLKGWTPLHVAAFHGRAEVVKLLLDRGANVEATTEDGSTVLHCVALGSARLIVPGLGGKLRRKRLPEGADLAAVTELLLKAKADLNALDRAGQTPLHVAARHGSTAFAATLLAHRAKGAVKDAKGRTPLMIAQSRGYRELVNLLRKE